MHRFIVIIFSILTTLSLYAGNAYEEYIERFSPIAIAQQEEFGIPASVTLAQGILESGAGKSTLASQGNNHFGIKCHKEWQGESMLRNDDAPDECFRVYPNPEESYRDHSLFLKKDRYASLFKLEITDYTGWAKGLKSCGYATDPNYAERLITIIERYALYTFDTEAGRNAEETVEYIRMCLTNTHPLRKSRGLYYVVATPDDTYEAIAREFGMSAKTLMEYNDADRHHDIKPWEEVYLQEKLTSPPEEVRKITIGEGESIHSVAQRFGMKVSAIKALNKKAKDTPGTVLILAK